MIIIQILLAVAAAYSGGMWLYASFHAFRLARSGDYSDSWNYERHTFHLGLCCILAAGFLGLLVR